MYNELKLFKFAFRNVLRNKRRTLLTAIVIMTSVGTMLFMFGYMKGFIDTMKEDSIKLTGHINLRHADYDMKERMLSLTAAVENYSEIKSTLENLPDIDNVQGRIKFGGLIDFNESNDGGFGMGIEAKDAETNLKISNSIVKGKMYSNAGNETVIGVSLARELNIDTGDVITIITRTAYGSMSAANYTVTGIADMLAGALNKLFVIPLESAQYLLDMENSVTEVVININASIELETMRETISQNIPMEDHVLKRWDQMNGLDAYLPMLDGFYVILVLLFGMIASFSIINTMLMSVLERTREIGVLTAFGMRRMSILHLFLIEAGIIGIIGGIFGAITGGSGAYYLEVYGLTIGKLADGFPLPIRTVLYANVEWYHIVISVFIGIVMSVLAAIYPARKAAKTNPTNALRSN